VIRDLIGIPFVDRGRDRKGLDCWGLAMAAMREYGKNVPDFDVSCFDTDAIGKTYERERWAWQAIDAPQEGDLAVMCLDPSSQGIVQHVGVYVGNSRMIHTMKKRNSHLVRIDDPYWNRKIRNWHRWVE
jgi:cell wall-associated NlpC family hydrolase